MRTITTIAELRDEAARIRSGGGVVGLVPTMGYMHEGHLSLMRAAGEECDEVVSTIFVNPLQFAAHEDLDTYPRDPEGDAAKAESAGTNLLFTPPLTEMYPDGVRTNVAVDVAGGFMESAARPTHFDGVSTVVAKLFAMTGPCRAYFGEKDYQQLAVIRRMARDLLFDLEVVGAPTVREPDGLALSSRNERLSPEARRQARCLSRALDAAEGAAAAGERGAAALLGLVRRELEKAPLARLDYAELRDPESLAPAPERLQGPVLLALAAFLPAREPEEHVRLIDNRILQTH